MAQNALAAERLSRKFPGQSYGVACFNSYRLMSVSLKFTRSCSASYVHLSLSMFQKFVYLIRKIHERHLTLKQKKSNLITKDALIFPLHSDPLIYGRGQLARQTHRLASRGRGHVTSSGQLTGGILLQIDFRRSQSKESHRSFA
jgi:hypothetical protein